MRRAIGAVAVFVAVAVAACGDGPSPETLIAQGDELFHGKATCQTCHGPDLRGTPMGPSLIDAIYAPGHHPDSSIRNAIRNGVQSHHWNFGPMPALTHLSGGDIDALIAYVRDQQESAGIR